MCVLFQLCTKARCSFLSAGPRAVNMLEHGDENQTTTNKCFRLPTVAILEQITKGLFLGFRQHGVSKLFLQRKSESVSYTLRVFTLCLDLLCLSFSPYQINEGDSFFFCYNASMVSRTLLEYSFGRVTESSPRAK